MHVNAQMWQHVDLSISQTLVSLFNLGCTKRSPTAVFHLPFPYLSLSFPNVINYSTLYIYKKKDWKLLIEKYVVVVVVCLFFLSNILKKKKKLEPFKLFCLFIFLTSLLLTCSFYPSRVHCVLGQR